MASKISRKSVRWNSLTSLSPSPLKIQRRTTGRRAGLKNMCSVRTRPIPMAPSSAAFVASGPESALVKTFRESGMSSAQLKTSPNEPLIAVLLVAISTPITSPVLPLMEMISFFLNIFPVVRIVMVSSASLMISSSQPQTQGLPHPRATTAACEVIPPLAVRIPCDAHMPPTSSGDVTSRTKMSCSELRASASVVLKTSLPTAAPGPPASPIATTLSL
mmetsp:Transcript_8625/g.19771  ORF Transcript_8625/g.19771 Transcript_8625/m.19771 type:complete len:218 (-) Transcript_8625:56-709(-)